MLIDPFYKSDVKYSDTSTGVGRFTYAEGQYVAAGLSIKAILIRAGWTTVAAATSMAVQDRSAFYFSEGDISGSPVEMTPAQCTTTRGPNWARAGVAGLTFNSYNPGTAIPTCPGGTNGIVWYPYDENTLQTAINLADKISELGIWAVGVEVVGDPGAGGMYRFTFLSTAPAFEADQIPIFVGGGDRTSLRGYYVMRSPEIEGEYLEIKIETRIVGHLGAFIVYDGLGMTTLCLTVTASGGGAPFEMPFYPGEFHFCANNHQVLIWPVPEVAATKLSNYTLLVSQFLGEPGHAVFGACAFAVASDIGDIMGEFDQLRTRMHWESSVGSGINGKLEANVWRGGSNEGYSKMSMLMRGTINRPTVSLAGQPLIEGAYLLAPSSPTAGPGPVILGKLWDILLTTGNAPVGKTMMYDGKRWMCFSTSTPVADVKNDMWVRM